MLYEAKNVYIPLSCFQQIPEKWVENLKIMGPSESFMPLPLKYKKRHIT
jgi:hypothetical protein